MEWHGREGVMRGVILHVPSHPAHEGVRAQGAGVFQRIRVMAEAEMLAGILQLMDALRPLTTMALSVAYSGDFCC